MHKGLIIIPLLQSRISRERVVLILQGGRQGNWKIEIGRSSKLLEPRAFKNLLKLHHRLNCGPDGIVDEVFNHSEKEFKTLKVMQKRPLTYK